MSISRIHARVGALVVTLLSCLTAVKAEIIYVSTTGTDATEYGWSWKKPMRTVNTALYFAQSGDQIWVAAGTYVERITLKNGVSLYGGFAGTETDLNQRDWKSNPTILDGNAAGCVVTSSTGAASSTRIDGFIIRNGSSGGISCFSSSPTIANNTITGNTGGGIYCYQSSPTIANNTITCNSSSYAGGGIGCGTDSSPIIINCVISGNSASSSGGGVYCYYSGCPRITNSKITGNSATLGGGVCCADGAGITLINNTLAGNRASEGGAFYSNFFRDVTIANTIIAFNSSGIYIDDASFYTSLSLRFNCAFGNEDYNYSDIADPTGTDGNIAADPKLVSPSYGNVHVQPESPCIDAGDDTAAPSDEKDIDGQSRIAGAHIDIGADESDGTFWPTGPYVIIRVSPDGSDANDGSSWTAAKRTVQPGIDAAWALGGDVWVAAGTYQERLKLRPYVHVYGGFGCTETQRDQRDWLSRLTTLDGQGGGSVITAKGFASLPATIDGFTIRNGKATEGGGIYCDRASPTIANNAISENAAQSGGGLYASHCSPIVANNIINANTASSGGGVYVKYSFATFSANKVTGNSAISGGGGICCYSASPRITGNTVTANAASNPQYAAFCGGGGVFCDNESAPTISNNTIKENSTAGRGDGSGGGGICCRYSSPAISNNTIAENRATGSESSSRGGGIYCFSSSPIISHNTIIQNCTVGNRTFCGGGGIFCDQASSPTISHNSIAENSAAGSGSDCGGGGIFCYYGSSPVIAHNTIAGNTATGSESYSGGGIYCCISGAMIMNNTISQNSSFRGGGVYCISSSPTIASNMIYGNSAYVNGGGIGCEYSSSPVITNNTIVANSAPDGGAITCGPSAPSISNTIIAFNSSGVRCDGSTPSLRFNCTYGNSNYNYSGLIDPTGTAGNISVDPRLASSSHGNLHLQPDSPCVDAGNDTAAQAGWNDIDGQARIVGDHIDIGADESNGTLWPTMPPIIVRVSPQGDDANDGSSWSAAKRTIQAAIESTSTQGGEVWVQAGTYLERITLRSHVHLYGGFSGLEMHRGQRDWSTHVTVLDGSQSGCVVTSANLPGYALSTLDGFTVRNGRTSYGGGVSCVYASPAITHNTITSNTATSSGGGVSCNYSSPLIANNLLAANSAPLGGGICCLNSSPEIVNNTITNNADCGVYCSFSSPRIANTIVAFNLSGVSSSDGEPSFRFNCTYGNTKYDYSGIANPTGMNGNLSVDPRLASAAYGNLHIQPDSPCVDAGDRTLIQGGWTDVDGQCRLAGSHVDIGADESDGNIWTEGSQTVVRVSTEGNDNNDGSSWTLAKRTIQAAIDTASPVGGDVWASWGTYPERITLQPFVHVYGGFDGTETRRSQRDWSSHITQLDGEQGGTVVTAANQLGYGCSTIDGFTIRNGKATYGAGIHCTYSSPTVANNVITANVASSLGGGIHCDCSSPRIINNTICGNAALRSGGISCRSSSSPLITNTILAFNSSGLGSVASTPLLRFNCAYANTAYNYSGLANPTGTNGNLSADPGFLRTPTPGPDGKWATADDDPGDLHLKPGSPCIDAGDNTAFSVGTVTDLDGSPRFFNDPATPDTGQGTAPIVDIGAYEYIPGDFNRDGRIDIADLTSLTACLSGPTVPYAGDCLGADFDRDNDVDQTDFGLLQRCFSGPTAPVDPACTN